MFKRILIVFFLLALSVMPGCGGGDDGGSTGDTRTGIGGVVVDGSPYNESDYYLSEASPLPPVRPNAKVFVVERATGRLERVAETTADGEGRFFVPLPPGRYSVYTELSPSNTYPLYCATGEVVEVVSNQQARVALGHANCMGLSLSGRYDYLL